MSTRPLRAWLGAVTALAVLYLSAPVQSSPVRFGPRDVTSLFTISKSENRNQVVYAIHLDAQCVPLEGSPIYAYWRMNEKGENVVEPLLAIEEKAYGIEHQRVLSREASGGKVEVALKAMPARPIVVQTAVGAGHCEAWSTLPISGEAAFLYDVYVKLNGPHVDYLLVSGWASDRSRTLHERLAR